MLTRPDAEKGDAVIELHDFTGKSYKDIAETELNVPEQTLYQWIWKASRVSPNLSELVQLDKLAQGTVNYLLKYPHNIQDQLATFIVDWNEKNPEKITTVAFDNFLRTP